MKIAFAGTPKVAEVVLRRLAQQFDITLVITRPDAPVGRKKELTSSAVAKAALELGIETIKTSRIDETTLQALRDAGASAVIVVAYGSLVPKNALDVMPWWNLHFSLLPLWRGATPLQHSLIHQSGRGITLFKLDEGLDTGPIIAAKELELDESKTAGQLLPELAEQGAAMIAQSLVEMPSPIEQRGSASSAPKLTRSDARLDFTESADSLQRIIHAFNPEPVAWCLAGESELRILRAKSLGQTDWNSLSEAKLSAGELEKRKGAVLVACGDGTRLELLEVQPAGKKPMSALEWSRGFNGSRIG